MDTKKENPLKLSGAVATNLDNISLPFSKLIKLADIDEDFVTFVWLVNRWFPILKKHQDKKITDFVYVVYESKGGDIDSRYISEY